MLRFCPSHNISGSQWRDWQAWIWVFAWYYLCECWIPFWLTVIHGTLFLLGIDRIFISWERMNGRIICFIILVIIMRITYFRNILGKKVDWVQMNFSSLKLLLWSRECIFFLSNTDRTCQHFDVFALFNKSSFGRHRWSKVGVFWTLGSGVCSMVMTPISGHYQNNTKKGAQRFQFGLFFDETFLKNYN